MRIGQVSPVYVLVVDFDYCLDGVAPEKVNRLFFSIRWHRFLSASISPGSRLNPSDASIHASSTSEPDPTSVMINSYVSIFPVSNKRLS